MSRSGGRISGSTESILLTWNPSSTTQIVSVEDTRYRYGELRLQSLGMWQGRVVFLVWTPRGDDTAHLISCRYANRQETDDYFRSL